MAAPRLEMLAQPFGGRTLGDALCAELSGGSWDRFRATVAFLKRSGARQVLPYLDAFLSQPGASASVAVGIDHDGTSLEGLQDLWRAMSGRGDLFVFKEGQGGGLRTFHPKAYLFERSDAALAFVGSGNLTAGGLYANHELTVAISLDLTDAASSAFHSTLDAAIDAWLRPSPANRAVDHQLLRDLDATGELLSEAKIAQAKRAGLAANRRGAAAQVAGRPTLFGASGATAQPPPPPPLPPLAPLAVVPLPVPIAASRSRSAAGAAAHHTFLIEVRPHHNGEIFLSKRAVDEDPGFFGAPFNGWTTPKRGSNRRYPQRLPDPEVEIVVHDAGGRPVERRTHSLNVVYYTRKRDIRITIPQAVVQSIPPMSLLAMTRNPSPAFDYRLDFYPPTCNAPAVRRLRARLTTRLPTGGTPPPRSYGWI